MPVAQIKMPQLGESVTEGTVDHWLKAEGDFVKRDEPLVEVVTDKVNAETPSPVEGKLVKIAVTAGETVQVGAVIAQIETGVAAPGPVAGSKPGAAPAKERDTGTAQTEGPPEPSGGQALQPAPHAQNADGGAEHARLSPAVRKLAAEHGLDPTTLRGSGLGGRVTRDDVVAAVGAGAATAAPQAPAKPVAQPAAAPAKVDCAGGGLGQLR